MITSIAWRCYLTVFTVLASFAGFSQSADSVVVVAAATVPNNNNPTSFDGSKNRIPNSLAVIPQLTERLPKNSAQFDAFRMKDGMTCITPDPRTKLKLKVVESK